ncbi:MAG: hypothetical protein ACFE9L_09075 [Candidatus Hodarchaeota archaeon]
MMLSTGRLELVNAYISEFETLYLQKEKGKDHLVRHQEESQTVKDYWMQIKATKSKGGEITEIVLKKLLPYNNTKHNRENGCRISVSPAITKDVKSWFEKANWQKPENWPLVSKAIFELVFELIENENWEILEEFENNKELSRGFKTGMLTPTFFHLNPEFYLINSKNIDTINYIVEKKAIDNSLTNYRKNIKIIKQVIDEINCDLFNDYTIFDMFCHWMCDKQLGGYARYATDETVIDPDEPVVEEEALRPEEELPQDHWEAIYYIVKIGNLLGYNTYVADPSKTAFNVQLREIANLREVPDKLQSIPDIRAIDAIWYKSVPPFFFFEVEHGGNMRNALLRLYNTIIVDARFFIVCPESNRPKFQKWVAKQPFQDIKERYNFRNYEELFDFYKTVLNYTKRRERFLTLQIGS